MLLKNKVAIYSITHDHQLSYSEIIDKFNWKHWLFMKVTIKNEIVFVRLLDVATFRDIEFFANGFLFGNPDAKIERRDYSI